VTPREFLARHWGRTPLFIPGTRQKVTGLFDGRAFWRALDNIDLQGQASLASIRAYFHADSQLRLGYARQVTAAGARVALSQGATLCINVISAGDLRLQAFAEAVKKDLNYPGLVRFNAYWSPPSRGLPFHFDARITCSIQVQGSKLWWFSPRAAVDWPRGNADPSEKGHAIYHDLQLGNEPWERADPAVHENHRRVVLKPGDVLILPAGVWHRAEAGPRGSLALNLAFDPLTPLEFLMEALASRLRSDPRWRALPPSLGGSNSTLPRSAARFLTARLAELRSALSGLDTRDPLLQQAWERHLLVRRPGGRKAHSSAIRGKRRA
jgi:hypothetical protein